MTKFECYLEKLERKSRAEKENAYNEALARLLETRSKQEAVQALYENLTFIVGTADLLVVNHAKTLVF